MVERGNKHLIAELLEEWLRWLIQKPDDLDVHWTMASKIPNTPSAITADMERGGFDKEKIKAILTQCFQRATRKLWEKQKEKHVL